MNCYCGHTCLLLFPAIRSAPGKGGFGKYKENRTFSYTKSPQAKSQNSVPGGALWRDSSLPLRRKEVRCTRWPFARGMPP